MARRQLEDRRIRKLGKMTSSYYVTIPVEAIRNLDWRKGQKLVIETDARHGELVIRDWEKQQKK